MKHLYIRNCGVNGWQSTGIKKLLHKFRIKSDFNILDNLDKYNLQKIIPQLNILLSRI